MLFLAMFTTKCSFLHWFNDRNIWELKIAFLNRRTVWQLPPPHTHTEENKERKAVTKKDKHKECWDLLNVAFSGREKKTKNEEKI